LRLNSSKLPPGPYRLRMSGPLRRGIKKGRMQANVRA
jgi:hypothetical protein